jgi:hypothetical protein
MKKKREGERGGGIFALPRAIIEKYSPRSVLLSVMPFAVLITIQKYVKKYKKDNKMKEKSGRTEKKGTGKREQIFKYLTIERVPWIYSLFKFTFAHHYLICILS